MTTPEPFAYIGHPIHAPHAGRQGEGWARWRARRGAWVGALSTFVGSGLESFQRSLKRGRLSRPRQHLIDALAVGESPARLAWAA